FRAGDGVAGDLMVLLCYESFEGIVLTAKESDMRKSGKLSISERKALDAYESGVMHPDLSPKRRRQLQQSAQQAIRENLTHPGEFIRQVYLKPFNVSIRQLAMAMDVTPSSLSFILRGRRGIRPEMALRLSR